MKVFKFGGASVRDEQSIKNLGSIVKSIIQKEPLVLVISAIGKTTNALEEVVNDFYFNRGDAIEKLQKIKEQHHQIASALGLEQLLNSGVLNDLFVEAEWLLEDEIEDPYDYIYDQIVAIGELLSTRIVQAYLAEKMDRHSIWVDARDVIKTDDCYREGTPDWHNTDQKIRQFIQPALDQQKTVVIAGFIGSTTENNTITLGREGSDFTAAILASLLKAESLTVWKDVPGIMTADPHVFSDAKLLPEIDYREALEMTFYGAKVIHPKTLKPLIDAQIPLFVRSFENPGQPGTTVSFFPNLQYPTIKVLLKEQTLLQLTTRDFTFILENHLSKVFQLAVEYRVRIQMMENLAVNLSLVVNASPLAIHGFIDALNLNFQVEKTADLALYTIRHFDIKTVAELKADRKVYIEEYNKNTVQLVVGSDLSPFE